MVLSRSIFSLFFLFVAIFSYGLFPLQVIAQESSVDTAIGFPEILVTESRLPLSGVGSQQVRLDSAQLRWWQPDDLADALAMSTTLFVKNYGPGRSATSSLRGAGSTHTPVLWNGLNLQSPILGQVDLSLLPMPFIDEVRLEYGGGSALWGSGPVGGVVHLNNTARFGQGRHWMVRGSAGSFGRYEGGAALSYSNAHFYTRTRAFYETADNDFRYTSASGGRERLSDASLRQWGLLQENYLHVGLRQQWGLHLWYQNADREIPPVPFSGARQHDRALRTLLTWQTGSERIDYYLRAAAFREELDYTDTTYQIDTDNRAWTAIGEGEIRIRFTPQQRLNIGINNTWLSARSTNYTEEPTQNRLALFAAYEWKNLARTMRLALSGRQERSDDTWAPFVPSLGLEVQPLNGLTLKGAVSRNYRQPAFDDRFFAFGGNPDLQAESGWTEELTAGYGKQTDRRNWSLALTGFNRRIDNWIIWLPDETGIWSPRNIREVWSRGLESKLEIGLRLGSARLALEGSYTYVRSTNERAVTQDDPSVGKQLIYTPRHQATGQARFEAGPWALAAWYRYTGDVFSTDDNSASLPAYGLADASLARTFSVGKNNLRLFGRVRNLGNVDYQVVRGYPMPGRQVQMGLRWEGQTGR